MTVSSTTNKVSYSGNGTNDTFAYTFKIFADADLKVFIRDSSGTETLKTITTHYTVTNAGVSTGGNVVFTSGNIPSATDTVVIQRSLTLTQGTDYVENDPFPAQSHEDALDRLTFVTQQIQEEVDRSIKASVTNTIAGAEFALSASDRANKVFAFDGSGDLSVTQELGTFRGNWAASTDYSVRDLVKDTSTNNIFIVNTAHTSSGAQPLTTNANSAKYDLIVDAASATTSATNAAASATTATTKASEAATSASNASTSETNAATSETNASTSETNAASSATAAAASATAASTSETNASTSATAAASSATAAAASETAASASETAAAASESAAATSETNAATSATTATTKASEASTSATNAATSESNASTSETNASTSATNAATSATAAAASQTAAATSETNASTSETNAGTSETNAATSATAAATSATAASTSATNAATSATTATTQATTATTKASEAATSATNAAASATSASTAQTAAETAQTAAEAAKTAAELAADNFDDTYLGAKSSDPTVDNDGDALSAGDLYFNTTANELRYYTGSAWVAIAPGIANVSEDTTPQLGGDLDTNGNDITFGDNDKAVFGAGSDLEIQHTGSHSFINETGTGNLYIQSSGAAINVTNGSSRNLAQFNTTAGTATLYHDNGTASSAKLATKSDGVDITGELQADSLDIDGTVDIDGATTITVTGNSAALTLESTDADANLGPLLTLFRNSSSPADSDLTGKIEFNAEDSAGNATTYTSISSRIRDVTNGTEDGELKIEVRKAGTNQESLTMKAEEVVFNEAGVDTDFRVESDSNTHALFVDAGNDRIGLGESSPAQKVHISDTGTASSVRLRLENSEGFGEVSTDSNAIQLRNAGGIVFEGIDNSYTAIRDGNNTERLRVNTGETVINESSADYDFRVESNNRTHALFVNAGNDQIGLGTNNPQRPLHIVGPDGSTGATEGNSNTVLYLDNNDACIMNLNSTNTASGQIMFSDTDAQNQGQLQYDHSSDTMRLYTSGVKRMDMSSSTVTFNDNSNNVDFRVESNGNTGAIFVDAGGEDVCFGKTTAGTSTRGFVFSNITSTSTFFAATNTSTGSSAPVIYANRQSGNGQCIVLRKANTNVGSIDVTASGTTYNTTSDRRLKTDIQPIADATDKLMQMQPVTHKWIADPDADAVHGFIAQDMQQICPEAVSGEDGGEEMMSMDYGRITPVLVAALQDAHRKIEQLEQRIAEMENN